MQIRELISKLTKLEESYGEDLEVISGIEDPFCQRYKADLSLEIIKVSSLNDEDGYIEYIEKQSSQEFALKIS